METYDLIMLGIIAVSVLFGFIKGFAWQIASIAAFGVSYFVSARFSESIAEYFGINQLIAMFGLFIATSLVIWIAYGVIHKQIEKFHLKSFDRQIGSIVGLGSGIAICLVVTFFSITMLDEDMGRKIVQSRSGKYISQVVQNMDGVLPGKVQEKVQPYLEKLDRELDEAREQVQSGAVSNDNSSQESTVSSSGKTLSEEEKWIRDIEKMLNEK